MPEWPHETIRSASLAYIRKHAIRESEWRFTRLDTLPERLGRVVQLEPGELSIVSCFIDAQRWYVMTSARIFGLAGGSRFSCAPLEVAQWRWGDFKHGGRTETAIATFALKDGTHLRISYEAGPAAMAPMSYGRFWTDRYAALEAPE